MVLTRKCGESVLVGVSVNTEPLLTVTVVDIGGGRVRLGFQVKHELLVHRCEVWERLQTEKPTDGRVLPIE